MAKPLKNQWEFGELFAQPQVVKPAETAIQSPAPVLAPTVPAPPRTLSVTELTGNIKRLLEAQLGAVSVTGEITNCRPYASGHLYFTLKDQQAQLSCVLFQRAAQLISRPVVQQLKDGEKVTLHGNLSVYEARGQYQLIVSKVELQGLGALQAAFERLKQKLNAEGLFDQSRKRSLPRYPWRIGIVTSPQGAAIRDVLNVISRRQPGLEVYLAGCRVQGDLAAKEIVAALRLLNDWSKSSKAPLDLILLTRGGGSLEDLWAFNEEAVVRAIAASDLPVISAVGHEIDFTISDFVADLRAATPSVAAELITEGAFSSRTLILGAGDRMRQLARRHLRWHKQAIEERIERFERAHPLRRLQAHAQRLDDLGEGLKSYSRRRLESIGTQLHQLGRHLNTVRPLERVRRLQKNNDQLFQQLQSRLRNRCQLFHERIEALRIRLELLSPTQVLKRGYSMTWNATTGRLVRTAQDAAEGDKLSTRLGIGEIESIVEPSPRPVDRRD